MHLSTVHIARLEKQLGPLTKQEASEMVRAGFLSTTDLFRPDGASEWKPLSELSAESESPPASAMERVQQLAASTSSSALSHATQLAQKLKSAAIRGKSQLAESTSPLLESFLPQIRKLVENQIIDRPLTGVQATLKDDEFLGKVFGATYDCLPKPICRFVTEESLVHFCMTRREELIGTRKTV